MCLLLLPCLVQSGSSFFSVFDCSIYSVVHYSPVSTHLNFWGCNLQGLLNKGAQCVSPMQLAAAGIAWVPSDVWDMGQGIRGSREDVSSLARPADLWCRCFSTSQMKRFPCSFLTLPTLNVPLHSHSISLLHPSAAMLFHRTSNGSCRGEKKEQRCGLEWPQRA